MANVEALVVAGGGGGGGGTDESAAGSGLQPGSIDGGFGAALPTTTTSGKTLLITAQYHDTNLWSVLSAEIQ